MKKVILHALLSFSLVILLASCGSSTEVSYFYSASPHVVPDTVYSNENHKLDLGLKILAPDKVCWMNDFVGYGRDSDAVTRSWYVTVTASVKRPMNATNCQVGYDTLHNRLVIPFDSAGTYRVDFNQVDSRGNLIVKTYNYKVK